MKLLLIPIVEKSALAVTGLGSVIGLFAADEVIPGWSDVGSVAKASILAALFSILSAVISYVIYSLFATMRQLQADHMIELNNSRAALMGEIKDSRESFGKVIMDIRQSAERQGDRENVVLHELVETMRQVSAGCAATQAKLQAEAETARRILMDQALTTRSELRGKADTARTVIREAADEARSVLHDEADVSRQRLAGESGIGKP